MLDAFLNAQRAPLLADIAVRDCLLSAAQGFCAGAAGD